MTTTGYTTLEDLNGNMIEGLDVLTDAVAEEPILLLGLTQLALVFQDFVERVNDQFGTDLDVATQESRQELQQKVAVNALRQVLNLAVNGEETVNL